MQNLRWDLEMHKNSSARVTGSSIGGVNGTHQVFSATHIHWLLCKSMLKLGIPTNVQFHLDAKPEVGLGDAHKWFCHGHWSEHRWCWWHASSSFCNGYPLTTVQVNAEIRHTYHCAVPLWCKTWGGTWRCKKIVLSGSIALSWMVLMAPFKMLYYECALTIVQVK